MFPLLIYYSLALKKCIQFRLGIPLKAIDYDFFTLHIEIDQGSLVCVIVTIFLPFLAVIQIH